MKTIKNKNGITLIALVITIIVLLILAGVTIATLTGDNGILTQATNAKEKTSEEEAKERVRVEVLGSYGTDGKIDLKSLNNNLKNNIPNLTFNGNQISDTNKIETLPATVKVNGYDVVIEGNVATPTDNEINAAEISKNPEIYYGAKVINYVPAGCDTDVGWKIFYADETNIYLIADNYIEQENSPIQTNSSYTRGINLTDILKNYAGTVDITDKRIQALNSNYFSQNYISTNSNMKATAYLMDITLWNNKFKDTNNKADYVIGSPTIEMILKSYNQKYNLNYQVRVTSDIGYEMSIDNGVNWKSYYSSILNSKDSLYVIELNEEAHGLWISSPSIKSETCLWWIDWNGKMDWNSCTNNTKSLGCRPVICLNSNVKLQKNNDNTYTIL